MTKQTEYFYKDIAKHVDQGTRHTIRYLKIDNRTIPTEKIRRLCILILVKKFMTEFVALRAGINSYREIDKCLEDKHCKNTKKCVVTGIFTFDD